MNTDYSLPQLGWQTTFQQQLTLDDIGTTIIARVSEHHRNRYQLLTEQGEITLLITANLPVMTVGDWLLLSPQLQFIRLLERRSLFQRKAAGSKINTQLIAANIDTVMIVCSLNDDFNLSRIERYLALCHEAQAEVVVILTKADLCADAEVLKQEVQQLSSLLIIETINALDLTSVAVLTPWCKTGKTLAFMGSSGVGKSTLVNTLLGQPIQLTGEIREDDSKGKHTTTGRSLHMMDNGCLLLDTPGMREIQLADCASGVAETFAEISSLASHCRFNDCSHNNEPGCQIQSALNRGDIDERRLRNYQKLLREQQRNNASLAERRAKDKTMGKLHHSIQNAARKYKNQE